MKKSNFAILLHIISIQVIFAFSIQARNLDSLVTHSLQFAQQQLTATVGDVVSKTSYPRSTGSTGKWSTKSSGSWTSGFFPGCLWYMYELTSDNTWLDWAQGWTAGLENEKYDTGTHDVGFIIFNSFGHGYRLTGDESYKAVIIKAAQSLATRYSPIVGCTKSWNSGSRGQYPVIIDNMMNLEILFWASENGGQQTWYDMAVSHAQKTMENHVRENGSTYHVVDYNPSTGAVIKRNTVQGYADESTWARGQAWGIYGFTMTYRKTGLQQFLDTAKRLANFYIDNLPDDHVPYWDFDAPLIPNEHKETSSAAIAASGLLELSTLVDSTENQDKYFQAAQNILTSIAASPYLAEGTNSRGILLHSNGNVPSGKEVDVSLIYTEYYYIEALMRYQAMVSPVAITQEDFVVPHTIRLFQNYPNPFNPETTIHYQLPAGTFVKLGVYDFTGCLVRTIMNDYQEMGEYKQKFNGTNLSSGIYFLVLNAGAEYQSIKMTLVK